MKVLAHSSPHPVLHSVADGIATERQAGVDVDTLLPHPWLGHINNRKRGKPEVCGSLVAQPAIGVRKATMWVQALAWRQLGCHTHCGTYLTSALKTLKTAQQQQRIPTGPPELDRHTLPLTERRA